MLLTFGDVLCYCSEKVSAQLVNDGHMEAGKFHLGNTKIFIRTATQRALDAAREEHVSKWSMTASDWPSRMSSIQTVVQGTKNNFVKCVGSDGLSACTYIVKVRRVEGLRRCHYRWLWCTQEM